MTHVDDLYEPGDDREPEPDEGGEQPLDLAEVEDAYKVVFPKVAWLGSSGERLVEAIPRLIAELSEARRRIAEFEALPVREVWALSSDQNTPPEEDAYVFRHERNAFGYAERDGKTVWRRTVPLHPWEPISAERPF